MRSSTLLLRLAILASIALLGLGCHVTGPRSIKSGSGPYNVALQQTASEQMLLNLVRLRYRDTPVFLNVNSISTSFSFSADLNANGSYRPNDNFDSVGGGVGLSYAERPTITYLPLHGEQFVRQLMTPMDPKTLLLLYHSGWSIDRILRVCVSRLGKLPNAPSASGPTPATEPEFHGFLRVAQLLRHLQDRGMLEMAQAGGDETSAIVLEIPEAARDIDETMQLTKLANIPKDTSRIALSPNQGWFGAMPHFVLVTRSISAAMFYLSQAVQVPYLHEEQGKVTVTRMSSGSRFDWRSVTGDLFQIVSTEQEPKDAYVKVRYRGHWFFIRDSDLGSKSTFSLLTQLFALHAGNVQQSSPVLTIPVAQ